MVLVWALTLPLGSTFCPSLGFGFFICKTAEVGNRVWGVFRRRNVSRAVSLAVATLPSLFLPLTLFRREGLTPPWGSVMVLCQGMVQRGCPRERAPFPAVSSPCPCVHAQAPASTTGAERWEVDFQPQPGRAWRQQGREVVLTCNAWSQRRGPLWPWRGDTAFELSCYMRMTPPNHCP